MAARMDKNLPVSTRISAVRLGLKRLLKENNMGLKAASSWHDRYGRLTVKDITRGAITLLTGVIGASRLKQARVILTAGAESSLDIARRIVKEL